MQDRFIKNANDLSFWMTEATQPELIRKSVHKSEHRRRDRPTASGRRRNDIYFFKRQYSKHVLLSKINI